MTYGSRGLVGGALSRSWRHVPRTVHEVTADGPPDIEKIYQGRVEPNLVDSAYSGRSADSPRTVRSARILGSGRSAHVLRTVRRTIFGWTRAARSDQLVAPIDRLAPPASILQNRFEALHSALCHD